MNKTRIDWCDYTINPIKGLCKHNCWYCYARRMYKRFKWDTKIKFIPEELNKITGIKEPSRIFICSTHDLFGEWIPDKWIYDIITKLQTYPYHTFLLLTKNPKRYADWTFRDNFWLGATWTGKGSYEFRLKGRKNNIFLSLEPLLDDPGHLFLNSLIGWIIIGALTGKDANIYYPREQWIRKVVDEADRLNIPIFMKNNLKKYWEGEFRQEFPKLPIYKT